MSPDGEIGTLIAKLQSLFLQVANPKSWRAHAACVTAQDIFFDESREDEAKQICAVCPVRIECLDDAIKWSDMDSVRGGLSDEERVKVVFHRKRYQSAFQASLGNALTVREDQSEDPLHIL